MMEQVPGNLADLYSQQIPERIKAYLMKERGLSWPVIARHKIGWHPGLSRIAISIFDREGKLSFFKMGKDPRDTSDGPKMLCWPPGARVELYGWEHLTRERKNSLIICEGEYDRLVLESHDIPAVTSTGGALTFTKEWADSFTGIPEVYICYDRDGAGKRGAEKVARLIPQAYPFTGGRKTTVKNDTGCGNVCGQWNLNG